MKKSFLFFGVNCPFKWIITGHQMCHSLLSHKPWHKPSFKVPENVLDKLATVLSPAHLAAKLMRNVTGIYDAFRPVKSRDRVGLLLAVIPLFSATVSMTTAEIHR